MIAERQGLRILLSPTRGVAAASTGSRRKVPSTPSRGRVAARAAVQGQAGDKGGGQ